MRPTSRASRLVLLVVLAAAWWGAGVTAAPQALAHAHLVSSTPSSGQVVTDSPQKVRLHFGQAVDPALCRVMLSTAAGRAVPLSLATAEADAARIFVSVPAPLPPGAYRVGWRVTGSDGHAITGAFGFRVMGVPTPAAVAEVLPPDLDERRTVGLLYGAVRWLAFVGFALLVGAASFMAVCRPEPAHHPACRRLVVTGWSGLAVASGLTLLLYGPYASGGGLSRVFDGALLRATMDAPTGRATWLRLALLGLIAVVLVVGRGWRWPLSGPVGTVGVLVLGAALASTWSTVGHSRMGGRWGVLTALDVLHLVAAAVWLGGLVTLITTTLRRSGTPRSWEQIARFSATALICVLVLIGTGSIQAYSRVGSAGALTDNGYGRWLLVKLALVAVTLGAAGAARRRLIARPRPAEPAFLRRAVLAEALLGVAVLGVTSIVVASEPARAAHASRLLAAQSATTSGAAPVRAADSDEVVTARVPFDSGTGAGGRGALLVAVLPTEGATTIHVSVVSEQGSPLEAGLSAALRRARPVGPASPVGFQRLDVGHFVSVNARGVPAGDWELGLAVVLPDMARATAVAAFTIR